jgi:SAM-dependent methyltransferase
MTSSDSLRNRAWWERTSDEYQQRHAEFIGAPDPHWGMWQIPESELGVLGDVDGKDALELGCGAAQWSIALARLGARPVGLDNSPRQLEHARRLMAEAGLEFPLVLAPAEDVPLPDASFDIVYCDHGGMTWGDPYATVPEAARLLRVGGLFAFSHSAPFSWLCFDEELDRSEPCLIDPYFGMHRYEEPDGPAQFNLTYGGWIRLFREHCLRVEALVELRPPAGAPSTYVPAEETEWARSWPLEEIWRCRKV